MSALEPNRRTEQVALALGGVVVLGLVVAGVVVLGLLPGADDARVDRPAAAGVSVPPEIGQDVRADITADGDVWVTHTVGSQTPLASLQVRVDQPATRPGPTSIEDVEVAADGAPVATLGSVGAATQRVPLGSAVDELTVTYRVDLAPDDDPEGVDGRALAYLPALALDYDGKSGPLRRRVVAQGEILNVACVRTAGLTPLPCGFPTADGWQVYFDDDEADHGLLVQVQLD